MSTILSTSPAPGAFRPDNAGQIGDGSRIRALRTVLLAGASAATLDLLFAFTFYGVTVGAGPIRILHSIASGAFGLAAFNGGIATAAFGLAAHYFILIVAASVYYAASVRMSMLRSHVVASGLACGIAIYSVMHYIVLPLSAAPKFRSTPLSESCEFIMHFVLGLAIAMIVSRATNPKRRRAVPR